MMIILSMPMALALCGMDNKKPLTAAPSSQRTQRKKTNQGWTDTFSWLIAAPYGHILMGT